MKETRINALKRRLSNRLTLMVIPHGTSKPRQITVTLSFLLFSLVAWTGLTAWAAYISAQHVDYWHSKLYTQMLTMKMVYLNDQVRQFGEKIDEVKDVEFRLEDLLRMGSRKAIIQGDGSWKEASAQGGPTAEDREHLLAILRGGIVEASWAETQDELNHLKQTYQARMDGYHELESWISDQRQLFRATPTGWPVAGPVTSHFGMRVDPFTDLMEFHSGIDIGNPWGAPIRATADGRVVKCGWEEGYGKMVMITHGCGYSSLYGHMSKILVKEGEPVCRGQIIGLIGATGRASGPHCHYEVWRFGRTINPYSYLREQKS